MTTRPKLELRIRSKRGETLSGAESTLVETAFAADADRYRSFEPAVHAATDPVGLAGLAEAFQQAAGARASNESHDYDDAEIDPDAIDTADDEGD